MKLSQNPEEDPKRSDVVSQCEEINSMTRSLDNLRNEIDAYAESEGSIKKLIENFERMSKRVEKKVVGRFVKELKSLRTATKNRYTAIITNVAHARKEKELTEVDVKESIKVMAKGSDAVRCKICYDFYKNFSRGCLCLSDQNVCLDCIQKLVRHRPALPKTRDVASKVLCPFCRGAMSSFVCPLCSGREPDCVWCSTYGQIQTALSRST